MFEVGFTELLVIFVLALVVLGPEKLPRVAAQVGRWVGRARAMARQFKDQLEEEVNVAEAKSRATPSASASAGTAYEPPPAAGVPPAADNEPVATTMSEPAMSEPAAEPIADHAPYRTEGHDAGPAPEPESSVYQPPAYATAPSPAGNGHSSEATPSAVQSPPSETASNDTAAPLQEPALRPGDVITSTHERGI